MQQFRTKGQKFLQGQWDKLKILTRDGTGRDILSKSGKGQSLVFCQNLGCCTGRDGTITNFFPMISCFRTSFSCFLCFFGGESDFFPGRPGTEEFVPGQRGKEIFLSQDKGTAECPIPDCLRTSHGMFHPLESLTQMSLKKKVYREQVKPASCLSSARPSVVSFCRRPPALFAASSGRSLPT